MDHKSRGYLVIINNYKFENPKYKPLEGLKNDFGKYKVSFQISGFKEHEKKEYESHYKMDHKSRGYLVIINNYKFENPIYKPLEGHKTDSEKYKKTFEILGFTKDKIKVFENQKAREIKEIMEKYANKDYTDCDCFVAVFLSHGDLVCNRQRIMGVDQGVFFEDLIDVFKKTRTLFEKPKLFFMDVCRGDQKESYNKSTRETEFIETSNRFRIINLMNYSDIII
jgi:hypothetical protein